MQNSGMLKAMAQTAVAFVPAAIAKSMPIVLGVLLHALSLLFDPDSALLQRPPGHRRGGRQLGVPKVQFAQAALLGQTTTGFPVSPLTPATFLGRRPLRHRARRPSAVYDSIPVRCLDRYDYHLRRARRVPSVRRVKR